MPAASFLPRLLPVLLASQSLSISAPKANAEDSEPVVIVAAPDMAHAITERFFQG